MEHFICLIQVPRDKERAQDNFPTDILEISSEGRRIQEEWKWNQLSNSLGLERINVL